MREGGEEGGSEGGWREGGRWVGVDVVSFHQESCPLNCALPMPGTADGDVVSRCQVLGRAGSVHHGADQCVVVCVYKSPPLIQHDRRTARGALEGGG